MLRASAGPSRGALLTKSTFFAFVADLVWILALQAVSGALFGPPRAPKGPPRAPKGLSGSTPGEPQTSIWARQSAPQRVANSNFMVFLSQEGVQGAIWTYFGSILRDF